MFCPRNNEITSYYYIYSNLYTIYFRVSVNATLVKFLRLMTRYLLSTCHFHSTKRKNFPYSPRVTCFSTISRSFSPLSDQYSTRWQKTRFVTIPMLSPTTFFLIVTGVIYTFRIFDLIKVLTAGGPANSTTVMVYYLYETAFINLKTGYASAMGLVLLVMVLIITIIQLMGQKKWVNY